ncbi:uncharacterized protein LOC120352762 [Nilaparvata lugens]|uniref:uncharacterized protein LOC120352762 n=1 Tax=Nilaparvata lugens TaxID=108931 RepID=UPI00193DF1FB|nr:uncharacterized protein LOC120352762 [Nilaparvata lugens]
MGRMKENLDYSQSFASFITFPDEDEGEIRVSQRFVGGNGLESGKPGENRFVSGKLGGNIFESGKPGKNRCDSGKLGRNGFESGKLDGSEFVGGKLGGNIFESGILRENETCERKKNDLESINGGDESYLVTFDDIIGAQNGEIEEEEEEEEDNYTEDIFAADEEIKNTVKDESKLETGIDKIRNKLMKFRRVE